MAIQHVFLDMDGVISDFVSAALDLHDRSDAERSWQPGEWDIPTVLGMNSSKFWTPIHKQGEEYWSTLTPYPWLHELIQVIQEFSSFTILSSPSTLPQCLSGKVQWLHAQFGGEFRDFLIGPQKHLCAKPEMVLIDDSDDNVNLFRKHGGQSILFPQLWNSNHSIDDRVEFVRRELHRIAEI